ncbi:13232_t:CDS:2, partial [Racocetra persica]
ESAQGLKIYSRLFIFTVIVHFIYNIYFLVILVTPYSDSTVRDMEKSIAIPQFVVSLVGAYFAKLIIDYTKIVELKKKNAQTPGRVEASNTTNCQLSCGKSLQIAVDVSEEISEKDDFCELFDVDAVRVLFMVWGSSSILPPNIEVEAISALLLLT